MKTEFHAFLGLTGYYRRFISDYATIGLPLTDLIKKTAPNQVQWGQKCEQSFNRLKELLCSSPILRSPYFSHPFVLQTDASDCGAGAVLAQRDDNGEEHPKGYYS